MLEQAQAPCCFGVRIGMAMTGGKAFVDTNILL